jgi:redox-sensitive bicupin YhaK (pirin superfamily)
LLKAKKGLLDSIFCSNIVVYTTIINMKTKYIANFERGRADFGWLKSYHSFSFGSYFNPNRTNFGLLRVLNDDTVAPGEGFGKHPHKDMEIISIPLEGDLEHKDSMGNTTIIKEGDIQVMSAGTGVEHSEYNKNDNREVKFLQIWIFPRENGLQPRYDQMSISSLRKQNEFYQILSPNKDDEGVWINQDSYMHLLETDSNGEYIYDLKKPENGVYLFLLKGKVEVADTILKERDAMEINETDKIKIKAESNVKLLVIEVPMK